jgi:hypothetical protein
MSHKRIFIGKNLVKLMASVSKFISNLPLHAQVDTNYKHKQWEISIQW